MLNEPAIVRTVNGVETVTIPLTDYRQMQRDIALLNALQSAGVDNWEWYDEAVATLNQE